MRGAFVSVLVLLRDHGSVLPALASEILHVLRAEYEHYELLLIDNGSRDGEAAVRRVLSTHPCVRYVRLANTYDDDIALRAGLETAIGDAVVCLAPETDPPSLIPTMVTRCLLGGGFVRGVRTDAPKRSLAERALYGLFRWYCGRYLSLSLPRHRTTFFALTRGSINALLKGKASYPIHLFERRTGIPAEYVVYDSSGRLPERKRSLASDVASGIALVVSISSHPLRLVTLLGLLASVLNLAYVGYIVLIYFLKRDVMEGWTTSSMQTATMFFFLFLMLTVFAEYLGRIMNEIAGRETYVVREERCSDVMISAHRRNVVGESEQIIPAAAHAGR